MLGEPGTVGAALREIGRGSGAQPAHVSAILHRERPDLLPHLTRTTRRALMPHLEEGDSGVEAVVWRELRANAEVFAELERVLAVLTGDAEPTRLRLHDVVLWLATTLRLAHAVALGRDTTSSGGTGARESGSPDPRVGHDAVLATALAAPSPAGGVATRVPVPRTR